MIDRGGYPLGQIDRSNIWASLPGAGYGQFEHKADSLIAKFKEAGGTVRERLMHEQSHCDYLPLCYLHHRLPAAAVNYYRDNAITYKAQHKCQRTEAGECGTTDMQMCQRDAVVDAKYG